MTNEIEIMLRRDLTNIMGDVETELEARDAEDDGQLAIKLVKAEIW